MFIFTCHNNNIIKYLTIKFKINNMIMIIINLLYNCINQINNIIMILTNYKKSFIVLETLINQIIKQKYVYNSVNKTKMLIIKL